MPDCTAMREKLMAYADVQLDADERRAVESHVQSCAACAAALGAETAVSGLLRQRAALRDAAPAALRHSILAGLRGGAPRSAPWFARLLAWRWTPRLAMAAVLAVLLLVPLRYYRGGLPSIATAAAARHACHDLLPNGDLPPCCTALQVVPGDVLGAPSEGAVLPDLAGAGLDFQRAVRCTFDDRPVNLAAYRDAGGRRFSLYVTGADEREFKLLRTRRVNGVTLFRSAVPAGPGGQDFDVALWRQDGFVYTLVGPAAGSEFEGALARLHGR